MEPTKSLVVLGLTSLSCPRGSYVIGVMTPWDACASSKLCRWALNSSEGAGTVCSSMTSPDNLGEAHFTGASREGVL